MSMSWLVEWWRVEKHRERDSRKSFNQDPENLRSTDEKRCNDLVAHGTIENFSDISYTRIFEADFNINETS